MLHYFALHKPYGVLSQFSSESGHPGILDLKLDLPKDVYPVGRLDRDSEGLLILTNDNQFKSRLTHPKAGYLKKYWVQVEGEISEQSLNALRSPMTIRIKSKNVRLSPATAKKIEEPRVQKRVPDIRYRATVPTSWLEIGLSEGKNRQIRRMTAQVGNPTLRLIRFQIGQLQLAHLNLIPGEASSLTTQHLEAIQSIRSQS